MTRFAPLQTVLTTPSPPCRDVWGIQVTLRAAHVDAVDVQELSRRDPVAAALGTWTGQSSLGRLGRCGACRQGSAVRCGKAERQNPGRRASLSRIP